MEDYFDTNIDTKEPWEYIEGEQEEEIIDINRESMLKLLQVVEIGISYILNASDTLAAAYGVAYALGLGSAVEGRSMLQVSKELGISSGTISQHTKQVRLMTGLPPSSLMLTLEQANNHREATLNNLN
jgi:hypothetical protein